MCYVSKLHTVFVLQEYASRQVGVPRIREDMEYVPQPNEQCPCKVCVCTDVIPDAMYCNGLSCSIQEVMKNYEVVICDI